MLESRPTPPSRTNLFPPARSSDHGKSNIVQVRQAVLIEKDPPVFEYSPLVPNFLCMTPYPTPKVFVVDKYGKVSVCSIPPKLIKPIESYTLFADRTDEWIESVVASSRYLIVYSRKKQDTMTGTLYFFTHECKQVPPLNGIHQSIPVHHILCDQTGNRIYCLDRMRCNIYYHTLPTNPTEIEACMKQRCDFIHFNTNFCALKMLQNDTILGFYEKNYRTVHLYDKQTAEKIDEFKCEHFTDKFESWGIIGRSCWNRQRMLLFRCWSCSGLFF